MRIQLEIKIPNVDIQRNDWLYDTIDSYLRLCDGNDSYNGFIPGYLTKENDFIISKNIDNSLGYTVGNLIDNSFYIIDDGLYEYLQRNNIDITTGQITLLVSSSKKYVGKITRISLSKDILEISTTNNYELNVGIDKTYFLGELKNEKLTKTDIIEDNISFQWVDGVYRTYPEITGYASIKSNGLAPITNTNGIQDINLTFGQFSDKRTYFSIKHKNLIEFETGSKLKVKSPNSNNSEERFIYDSSSTYSSGIYTTKIFIDNITPSTSSTDYHGFNNCLTSIDEIEFSSGAIYFEIPEDGLQYVSKVQLKLNGKFYSVQSGYSQKTINGRNYLKLKSLTEAWVDIKIDKLTHSALDPYNQSIIIPAGDGSKNDISKCLSDDMSDFYAWNSPERTHNKHEAILIESSELKNLTIDNLYIGIKANLPSFNYDTYIFPGIRNSSLKYWPGTNIGGIPEGNTLGTSAIIHKFPGSFSPVVSSYHIGSIPPETISTFGDPGAISDFMQVSNFPTNFTSDGYGPYNLKNWYLSYTQKSHYLSAYDIGKLYRIDENIPFDLIVKNDLLLHIQHFMTDLYYDGSNPFYYIINKIKLLSKSTITIDDTKEIYIDYYDPTKPTELFQQNNFLLSKLNVPYRAGSSIIDSKLLIYSGDNVLEKIKTRYVFMDKDNSGYFYQLGLGDTSNIDSQKTIIEDSIIDVKTIDIGYVYDAISYPKIIFYDEANNEHSIELIYKDNNFPQEIDINDAFEIELKKYFKFSGNMFNDHQFMYSLYVYCLKNLYNDSFGVKNLSKEDIKIDIQYIYDFGPDLFSIYDFTKFKYNNFQNLVIDVFDDVEYAIGQSIILNDKRVFNGATIKGYIVGISNYIKNGITELTINVSDVIFEEEQLEIYDQGLGDFDEYIDQGVGNYKQIMEQ